MMILPAFSHAPIDIHSHFSHTSGLDRLDSAIHIQGLDFLERVYENAGVSAVGLCSFDAVSKHTACIADENTFLHRLLAEKDRVRQWVVIDPRQKETFSQADAMLTCPKVLGIKIHPDYHCYDISGYADELFSFAHARKAAVLMHPQHIEDMPRFADKYPDMKLIIAHLGTKEHVDAMAKSMNIYTDTSGSASTLNNIVEYAVGRVGSQRILFGTDTYSFAMQFGRIALSALSFEEKENILWKNAKTLFEKAFL